MDTQETIQEIRERLVKIEILLQNLSQANDLKLETVEEKIKVSNHRIDDLEKNNTWLWRTVVAALIGGAIALLFK